MSGEMANEGSKVLADETQASELADGSSSPQILSPMHSPPVQRIEREEEQYDSQRIPNSVFARSDTLTPAEWSAVSTESLFSLHGTHPSMSREYDFLLTEEVKRLTELSKSGELSPGDFKELRKLVGMSKSREFFKSSPPGPLPTKREEVEDEGEVQVVPKLEERAEVVPEEPKKETPEAMLVGRGEEKEETRPSSSTASTKSDGRGRSVSFAFPVLANGGHVETNKGHNNHQQHSEQNEEPPPPSTSQHPTPTSCSFLSCFSCFSCSSSFSCGTRLSCFSFSSCLYCTSCCSSKS